MRSSSWRRAIRNGSESPRGAHTLQHFLRLRGVERVQARIGLQHVIRERKGPDQLGELRARFGFLAERLQSPGPEVALAPDQIEAAARVAVADPAHALIEELERFGPGAAIHAPQREPEQAFRHHVPVRVALGERRRQLHEAILGAEVEVALRGVEARIVGERVVREALLDFGEIADRVGVAVRSHRVATGHEPDPRRHIGIGTAVLARRFETIHRDVRALGLRTRLREHQLGFAADALEAARCRQRREELRRGELDGIVVACSKLRVQLREAFLRGQHRE